MNNDILRNSALQLWDWLGFAQPEIKMLLIRWAIILVLAMLFGHKIKKRYQAGTLPAPLLAQIVAIIAAVVIGLLIPLDRLVYSSSDVVNAVTFLSVIAWAALPYVAPRYVIRSQGIQQLLWKWLYGIEVALFLTQTFSGGSL